ncbi:unnamed protein product [Adineta ricciae]|uniref:TLC domain-containing protein n=1 Tax=Adineta ricciae TaxID=249248 RepID=A0A816FPZ7_ADIRI|nr:unnamed protein product [Adineta ricciae]
MNTKAYIDQTDLFPYEPIHQKYMFTYILLSFMFFTYCNQKIHRKKSNWLQQNTLLSFIHASICSILLIIGVLRATEMLEDPLSHANHFNYTLLAFSIGYFLYDFVDCVQNSTTSVVPILIHHIIVIVFFSHVLYYTRNIGYAIYGLSLEINSVFLHARRLIRWYSPFSKTIHFQNFLKIFIDIGNYVTFVLFRFGIVIAGLRALHREGFRLNPIARYFTVLITMAMGVFNFILFYRLVKNQLFGKQSKRQKPSEDDVLVIDNRVLLPS